MPTTPEANLTVPGEIGIRDPNLPSPVSPEERINGQQTSSKPSRAITWRSVLLGLCGVVFVCAGSPYNDLAMANTVLVGNYMPVGALLFLFAVIAINAALARWFPRRKISGREMAVSLAMVLVSCAIPGYGLMRYLPSSLIGMTIYASGNPDYVQTMHDAKLPDWLFPTFESADAQARGNDPVVRNYLARTPPTGDGWADRFNAVPWSAWARPALSWGLLLAAVYGAGLCMSVIVRRQWVENERLAFPLATAYASLIEPPAPGRMFNQLFHSWAFRVGFGAVFAIHLSNGLGQYWPRYVPPIPLSFNLSGILSESPWVFGDPLLKSSTIFFSVVGMTYFVPTRVAFSLWAFFVLRQAMQMQAGVAGTEMSSEALSDQVFGAVLATGATILWIGRHHLAVVGRHMLFRPPKVADGVAGDRDEYLSYAVAGWGLLAFCAAAAVWLVIAGMSVAGAIVLVGLLILTLLVMARVVAETGLIFATVGVWFMRLWAVGSTMPLVPFQTTPPTFFWTNWINHLSVPGLREALPVYATHALCVNDRARAMESDSLHSSVRRTRRGGLILLLGLSLLVGYLASGASTLFVEYNYAATLGARPEAPLNGSAIWGSNFLLEFATRHSPQTIGLHEQHNGPLNVALGAAVTGLLTFCRLRWAWWPLHPVGYLLWQSYPLAAAWFSIFLGWLAKVFIVKFGGGKLFQQARPFFLGLVLGEAGAAAFWLATSIILNALGIGYHSIVLFPG